MRDPKIQLVLTLLPILVFSLAVNFSQLALINSLVIISSTILSDFLFLKIRKKNLFFPSAAIVTGLIISLIVDPSAPIYIPIAASVAAIFSKNFLRPSRHIFNPAAFGMLFVALLSSSFPSWWGPSSFSSSPLLLVLLFPALISFYRMRRYVTITSFFASYAFFAVLFGNSIQRVLLDPTLIFFSLVMAPEPMTTPVKRQNQLLFGLLLSITAFVFARFLIPLPILDRVDPLIFSLLLGNLIFFRRR